MATRAMAPITLSEVPRDNAVISLMVWRRLVAPTARVFHSAPLSGMASRTNTVRQKMRTRTRAVGGGPRTTPDGAPAPLFDQATKPTSKATAGAAIGSRADALTTKHIAANLSFCALNDSAD